MKSLIALSLLAIASSCCLLFGQKTPTGDSLVLAQLVPKIEAAYFEGDYPTALAYAEQALEMAKEIYGEEHPEYGASLNNIAFVYDAMGRYDEAIDLTKRAVDNAKNTLGKQHEEYCLRLGNLARYYQMVGKLSEAETLMREALQCGEQVWGTDHIDYGSLLNNLGMIVMDQGKLPEALALFEAAIDNAEGLPTLNLNRYSSCLNNMAGVLNKLGQYDKVLPIYEKVLELTEQDLGKDNISYGISLVNLARHYEEIGEYQEALPRYLQGLEIVEPVIGTEHLYYGTIQSNLAMCYVNLGQMQKGLEMMLTAKTLLHRLIEPSHLDYQIHTGNLAGIYVALGQYEEALSLYQETDREIVAAFGKQNLTYVSFLGNYGELYEDMGQFSEANMHYQEALQLAQTELGTSHPAYGKALGDYARGQYKSGNVEEAFPLFEESLSLTEQQLGKEHPEYAMRLGQFAQLLVEMNQPEKALPLVLESRETLYRHLERNFAILSEQQQEALLQKYKLYFDAFNSFVWTYHKEFPDLPAYALNHTLQFNGLLLESSIQLQNKILDSGEADLVAGFEEWKDAKQLYANQFALPLDKRQYDLDSLEEKIEAFEQTLSLSSRDLEFHFSQVDWTDIQNGLEKQEAYVEFIHIPDGKDILYAAIVLHADWDQPRFVSLFEQAELEVLMQTGNTNAQTFVNQLYSDSLYHLIWKEVEEQLPEVEYILYSSTGLLHQINIPAIVRPDQSHLLDVYAWTQLSHGRQLVEKDTRSSDSVDHAVLYGGITYTPMEEEETSFASRGHSDLESRGWMSRDERAYRNRIWQAIPKTEEELKRISSLLTGHDIKISGLSKHLATEESFKLLGQQFDSPDILHFAGHGFFFPSQSTEIDSAYLKGRYQFQYARNPLMRSGLVLAGANKAWKEAIILPGKEDGILTAYEISSLNLSHTDLVVLSACKTGLGDIRGTEGVYGLQRAFKRAGAGHLILTLWSISDSDATVEFMETFYQNWFSGESIRTAFQQTQKQMKDKYPDPYFWAGFVLVE